MAGVFLSHSSKDKAFVTKLAVDLVNRGIPVWFDSWELEAGESLFKRIFDGIDDSTYLILALSPHSVESKWVQRELEAALAKEDQIDRKVILPIKVANCAIPRSISSRLYSDFTGSYLEAFEKLERQLRKYKLHELKVPFDKQLIPLKFSKGQFLEHVLLQTRIEQLVPQLESGSAIMENQLIIAPDALYDELRANFISVVENIESNEKYTPDLDAYFKSLYEWVRRFESGMMVGIAEIINGMYKMNEMAFTSLAVHWYCRLIRNELLVRFATAWEFNGRGRHEFCQHVEKDALSTPESAARLFGVDRVYGCDIFNPLTYEYTKAWIDQDTRLGQWLSENPSNPEYLVSHWTAKHMFQFVVPQMVIRHHVFNQTYPIAWDLQDWVIGAA